MVRQTKCHFALVLFLAAVLVGLLAPTSLLAGRPGDYGGTGTLIGSVPGGSQAGGGGGGGSLGSGDPDELGIYRVQASVPGANPSSTQLAPPRTERRADGATLKLHMLWRFLLGCRFPGF